MNFDLIVIGAGLTGLIAAQTAVQAGLKVKIISKGLGALHWGAGTIDALGYYPDDLTPVTTPLETVPDLVRARPGHPYAILNGNGLADALKGFAALTTELGLPYIGAANSSNNLWLPSPVGSARPAFLAPRGQIEGDLSRNEPMLIVGFSGMRDFYPELIAENLTKQGHRARPGFLPLDLIADRHDLNNVQLAQGLDSPQRQAKLAGELKRLVEPGERVGLPAVVGMDDHVGALNRLQASLGVPVFEIPTLPPSVPGIRLNTALRRQLEKQGVRVEVNAEVVNSAAEGDRITSVKTQTSGRPLKHPADKFLLATGGFLGGGINSDHTGRVWEVVLNLPLALPRSRDEWFGPRFFDPAGHPIFRAGVPVDRQFQPVDANGARVYANVWAAGSLLAHADPIMERSLEGIAISTGIAAARCAAQ